MYVSPHQRQSLKGWTIPNPGGSFWTQGWSSSGKRNFRLGGTGSHLTASYGEASRHQEFIFDPSMSDPGFKMGAKNSYPDHYPCIYYIKFK